MRREVYSVIQETIDKYQIPIIVGHRRVGKTTILRQLAEEYPNSDILLLDSTSIRKLDDDQIVELLEQKIKSGVELLLLDEVQVIDNWDVIIKEIYDKYMWNKKVKMAITGSSAMSFVNKDTGVDRTKKIIIGTLSFNEYLQLTNKERTHKTFEEFLSIGGFPQHVINGTSLIEQKNEILDPIVGSDLPKYYEIKSKNLDKLIEEIALITNGEFNKSKCSTNTGMRIDQIDFYLDIFEQSHIIKRVYQLNEKGEISRYPKFKIYLNPHFHLMILRQDFSSLENKYKGHIVESYYLFRNWAKEGVYAKYNYLKNVENKEIDFVRILPTKKDNIIFESLAEVKYDDRAADLSYPLFLKIKSINKYVICKENKKINGIDFINILDI